MALQPQIVTLVEKLTELTRQNKIAWETTADEDTFLTSAGKFVVTITHMSGTGENAGHRIQLLNDAGQVVEQAGATVGDYGRFSSHEIRDLETQRQLLQSLYEMARRSALHADE